MNEKLEKERATSAEMRKSQEATFMKEANEKEKKIR